MTDEAHHRMVTLARDAKGWTQGELAEAAGVSQGFLSKVEHGLTSLSGDRLDAVAAALEVPTALLTGGIQTRGLEVTCLHHRRRHSRLTAAKKRQIEAISNLTRVSVEGLMQGVDLVPEAQLMRIDIDDAVDAAEIARRVRVLWRIPSGPIENMTALLEALGIVIVARSLGTSAQDAVSTWPHEQDRPPVMLVNTSLPADRYRFTLAHELGHLVMHNLPSETQEDEANQFAAELLAPAQEIHPQLVGLSTRDFPRLVALKQQWRISVAALIRRAHDLGTITQNQYRTLMIEYSQLGWRTVEPAEPPAESPRSLQRVIQIHLSDHGYSEENLATVAGMLHGPFRRTFLPATRPTPTTTLKVVRE